MGGEDEEAWRGKKTAERIYGERNEISSRVSSIFDRIGVLHFLKCGIMF